MKKSYLSGLLVFCFMVCAFGVKAAVPIITTDPKNDTVCSGTHALFTVAAIDTPGTFTLTFKWQMSTDGGTTWATVTDTTYLSGTTNDTLNVTASAWMNGYKVRCIVSDTIGSDTSAAAMLSGVMIAPGTISGPSIVCKGSSIALMDTVSGGTWSSVDPAIATITSGGVLTGHLWGYDTVKYTDSNMCGMGVAMVVIRVDSTPVAMPISGPTVTCVGHTIALMNGNVIGTWNWNTSNGRATATHDGMVTGVSYGLDTITYVFTNACNTVSSTMTVQVDTVLSAGTIAGASAVCTGSWIHLTESVPGGTWFSSNSSIAVVDGSGNVTGVSQGVVTISYFLTNGCGASIATHGVTVNAPAASITGLDSVGVGDVRILSNTTTGGTWSIADTAIATIDSNGHVTGVDSGLTMVTYTVVNACGTSYATLAMHVGPHPTVASIAGSDSVCIGANITLTNATGIGKWNISDTITHATVDSVTGVVHGVAYGATNVTFTYTNGFGTSTSVKTIFVNRPPSVTVSDPGTYGIGSNIILYGTPSLGVWSQTNSTVAMFLSVTDSNHYASMYIQDGGTDIVTYTVHNTCGTSHASDTLIVVVDNGVKQVAGKSASLNIFPNPNQGAFTLNVNSDIKQDASVVITNVVGEKVKELSITTNQKFEVKLDQPSGIYVISVTTADGTKYTARIAIGQ
jgi:Secretion system C-terminal sorting domain/Bacterial Ig-like domain (group 2)